ncbi:cyoD [Wigglesworthia glossinidia endosymbiont of Glossina brevipalpis]|uniref:Cytochrome bo(3) ubiquinol oxidase subunit 4 n=1 Tax=Wigglesworthia glossinidia brevipalpis TaxID=36870 RepID=Q8D351_WIGBR|nr:cyoD [Wigglesworthia glossinidia endosymbiont of Glossina brevipalpis]
MKMLSKNKTLSICKNNKSYFIGYILSFFFTCIPFLLIINKWNLYNELIYNLIIICAFSQAIIQFTFFLNIFDNSRINWKLISLTFTILIIFILIFGSIWIMNHLHHNLM